MKPKKVVFFACHDGEKLEDEINKFFSEDRFQLVNVAYGCCYNIKIGKVVHNAMVTYEYLIPDNEKV